MCLGIPGRIEKILGREPLDSDSQGEALALIKAMVSFGDIQKEINLSFVPEASVGDYVLVHVGFAISRIDDRDAQLIYDTLEEWADREEGQQ